MVKSTLEQLEEVQSAISKVMEGQDVQMGNKRVSLADLSVLQQREDTLLRRHRIETGKGGSRINIGTMRRRV